jgi:predicted ATPase
VIDHVLASDGFTFEDEHFWDKTREQPYIMTNSTESRLLNAAINDDLVGIQIRKLLLENRPYQFHDTSDTAYMKLTGTLDDDVFLKSDAGNLAAVLFRLKNYHPKHYQKILRTIRLSTPYFKDFVLEPNGRNIRLRYLEFGSETVYGAHQLSDGTLRLMALLTLLLQPMEFLPNTILIDEPELGLHPHALETVLSVMRSIGGEKQIIIATQSVSIVDRLEPEDIIVAQRHGSETQFTRLDATRLESWLEEYSLGELWEKNVLGGRPS